LIFLELVSKYSTHRGLLFFISANDTSSTETISKPSESFSTDPPLHFSSFESSSSPPRNPAVLSQEQIYEKLGEHTMSPSFTGTLSSDSSGSAVPLQEGTTIHVPEDIQSDENTINPPQVSSVTVREKENNNASSAVTERLTTIADEAQPTESLTEKESTYTYKPSSPSAASSVTTISDETTTELPTVFSSAKTTQTIIHGVPSTDLLNHEEELVTNTFIYQSTKSPPKTTKFESNNVDDQFNTETNIHDNFTPIGNNDGNSETTVYPVLFEGKPGSGDQSTASEPSSSSESNRFTFTTREFDRSTTIVKEEETVGTSGMEQVLFTVRPTQETLQQVNETVTDNIDTVSEKITEQIAIQETAMSLSSVIESEKVVSTTTEEAETAQFGIPGEGSCLVDGITYPNTSVIESSNPCHNICLCLSSVPTCTLIDCQRPPSDPKCMPVQIKPESCCPVYVCSKFFINYN
jgi:hypothetical protein